MILQIVLFFLQDFPLAMIFITIIILFFTGSFIYLIRLNIKNNKNKKVIEQARIRLDKIQQAKDQIEKQAKEKNLFYTSLFHDIKIPLSIIHNSLIAYCTSPKKKDDENLISLKTNVEILNRDIVNILDTEKIDSTQQLYNHKTILNISKAVKKTVDVFKCNTNNKKIALTLTSEGALYIKINPCAFERVVNNLLDNAVKYTPIGGEINVSLHSDSLWIYLKIKDNGKGIAENELSKIFKIYYQGKKEEMSKQGSLGIGLFLVKNIIDSVNGKIKVESEINKGTTFTIIFPKYTLTVDDVIAIYSPEKPVTQGKVVFAPETYDKNKFTIMIVDDNQKLLMFLQKNLLCEYNVYYATNGKEALDKLMHIPKPELIISDVMMGEMDGHEFYSRISKDDRYNEIPFIFLTSRTGKDEKLESLKKGAIDYICKPFLIEELKAKIGAILTKLNEIKELEIKKIEKRISTIIRTNGDDKFLYLEKKTKKYKLSPREKEVLQELIYGLQIKEIASKLFLSTHTIRNHIRRIYEKCKVQNRVELTNLFRE